jgi:hypothetical protein
VPGKVAVDATSNASPTLDPRDVARIKPVWRQPAAQVERPKRRPRASYRLQPALERLERVEEFLDPAFVYVRPA